MRHEFRSTSPMRRARGTLSFAAVAAGALAIGALAIGALASEV